MKHPLVRYHSGKWRIAPKIIQYFAPHRVYVEPYGGGGSVLLRKPRSYAEIYNDLDGEIVNLFKVVRDHGYELKRLIELTLFSRDEFVLAYEQTEDEIEMARRTLIRFCQGFGSGSIHGGTGFRANSNRCGTTPAHDWTNYPNHLPAVIDRLRGVFIENRPALQVLDSHDSITTIHYVDPPFLKASRGDMRDDYVFEMSDDNQIELSKKLSSLNGMVILSGYPCELNDELYAGWNFIDISAMADVAKARTERLWFNDLAWKNRPQQSMFAEDAS